MIKHGWNVVPVSLLQMLNSINWTRSITSFPGIGCIGKPPLPKYQNQAHAVTILLYILTVTNIMLICRLMKRWHVSDQKLPGNFWRLCWRSCGENYGYPGVAHRRPCPTPTRDSLRTRGNTTLHKLISLGQNGRHFTDDNFICNFVNENFCILIKISLKFFPRGVFENNPELV